MREYIIKRLVVAVIILWIIASLNFVIFQVISPLSPEKVFLDPDFTPEVRESIRQLYGLADPMHIRYAKYIVNMFTWNFGFSFLSMAPVVDEMAQRLPATVLLLGTAMIGTILVGIPAGILAASRRGSKIDVLTIGGGLVTWGVPTFFIQLLFVLFLSYYAYLWFGFSVFPPTGLASPNPPTEPIAYMADVMWHLGMPVMTLIIASFGSWALYTRSLLLDALTQDYVVTARAKGLSERTVLYRHAFRSTLPPIVTMIALNIPGIIGGAMITEYIFTLPGIGQWYLSALNAADFPVVQSVLFIFAVLTLICNLAADLMYGVLDPRIRVGARR